MKEDFKTGRTVSTTRKHTITDPQLPAIFVKSRKDTTDSILDSPIYMSLNRLWLVKHSRSKLYRGISIGYYGIYHEDELELIETLEADDSELNIDY